MRPLLLGNLAGRVRQGPQRLHHRPLRLLGDPVEQAGDLRPAALGDGIDQRPPRRRQRQPHGPAVTAILTTPDQALTHQSVTQARDRRRRHAQLVSQRRDALRAAGGQHHQRAVLRQRHLIADLGQRTRGDRDQHTAGGQHRIDHRLSLGLAPVRNYVHTTIIAYSNWRTNAR